MAGTVTLKEFLIRLGFRVDQSQERNFNESMQKTAKGALEVTKAFAKIASATVAGMTASGFAIHKVSEGLAGLYYASQRTGASVKELKVLQYGFEQVGLSAEDAQSSVEALAAARRQNPGLNGLLSGLGVKPDVDNAKVLVDLLGKLRGMAPYMRAQYASILGLDEGVINQLELNGAELKSAFERREQFYQKSGYDPDKAAKDAVELTRAWNDASGAYKTMFEIMAVKLLPVAERFITVLEKTADWLLKVDKSTGGWVTNLGALGIALTPILAALKISGAGALLTRGLGGAAAGAGAAGVGGAGLLATVGLPAVVLAALGALIWLVAHPNELQAQVNEAHKIGDKMRGGLKSGLDWLNEKGKSTMADLQKQPGFIGDLARMTGKFEGFRDHVYNDIAGNKTFGFGHKLKPGESMIGADPFTVFAKDLGASVAAVMRRVKVKLSENQLKALADLEFNIGEGAFAKSALLRKLNRNDFAGASHEFQRWVFAGGFVNQGLVNRRAAEAQLFRTPDGKQVTINAPTTINVDGSGSPKETAREIGRQQNRQYGDLVRNFGGAIQ